MSEVAALLRGRRTCSGAERIDSDHATEGEDGGMFRENVI